VPDSHLALCLGEVFRPYAGHVAGAHRTAGAHPGGAGADQSGVAKGLAVPGVLTGRLAAPLTLSRVLSHGGQHGGQPLLLASGAALRA
jgi:hypothetical protein